MYNSILETTDLQQTQTWADACRIVYAKTYEIVEMNRLKHVADLHDLGVKYNSLEEKWKKCQRELDELKAPLRKEPSRKD